MKAREMQEKRFAEVENVHCNAQMTAKKIQAICKINDAGRQLLKTAMERLGLSARAYDSILKVSRTIADLDGAEEIQNQHLAEAIQYRSLDRDSWAG
jgi:magnesium chelatase family protein